MLVNDFAWKLKLLCQENSLYNHHLEETQWDTESPTVICLRPAKGHTRSFLYIKDLKKETR